MPVNQSFSTGSQKFARIMQIPHTQFLKVIKDILGKENIEIVTKSFDHGLFHPIYGGGG